MRMCQYICHTDHNLWDIIFNGDLQEEPAPTGDQSGPSAPPVPKFAKQLASKKNQERVSWVDPISKEDINQKFLRSLPPSWNQIALIMINKPDIDEIDIDDLYNNLRVYEEEMKRSSSSTSTSQNFVFLSLSHSPHNKKKPLQTSTLASTNEVSTASGDFGVSTAGGISQIDEDDLEELDLRWQVAMLTVRVKKFIQKTGRNLDLKEKRHFFLDKSKIECYNCHRKGHFARDCRSGRNQGRRSYGDNGRSNAPTNESSSQACEISLSEVKSQVGPKKSKGLDEYAIRKKIIKSKTTDLNTKTSKTVGKTNEANTQKPKRVYETVNRDKVIIEDWNSDDEDDVSEEQTISSVKTNETQTVKTRVDKIGQTSKKAGIGFKKIKACFVCKSTDHLIKDCDFYDKKSPKPKLRNMVNTG
ncbi:retrovirus-related pol polyprotein from transposon TNT 1-94 [Tanacetum coccineum]